MTDSKQDGNQSGFTTLAKQIDSKIDPDFVTLLKYIEIWNEMLSCDIFGNAELIPVGSCVDGSKVAIPSDCGDMDVLMLSSKIILKEHLFDYDKSFPAFLHIRVNNEHQKYFKKVKDPIEGVYLPAAVLKELHKKSPILSKAVLKCDIQDVLSEDGKFLKVTKSTSVGKEQMQLYPNDQNAFDSSDKPDMFKFELSRTEKFVKCILGGMISVVEQTERIQAKDESSAFDTNNRPTLTDYDNTSLLEMLNKILDMSEGKGTHSDKTINSSDTYRDRHINAADNGKGYAMQGTTYLDKKDNKTPRDTFSSESLRANSYKKKIPRACRTTNTKQNDLSSDSKLDDKHRNKNATNYDPALVKGSCSVGACIKKTTKYENAGRETSFSKLRSIDLKHKNKNAMSSDPEGVKESHSVGACNKKSGTAKRETSFSKLKSIDFVPAFKFEGWPRVADEWVTRSRKWPSKVILKKILESGCQVVAKRPLALYSKPIAEERDPYFRLSFALSEIILAQNMKEQQLLCWRVLKAYQKCFLQTKPKCLSSYHWKNVMFWVNEDLDESFWTDENVPVAVKKCLDYMTDCLRKRNLPFYFVRRMNLLNGCDETLFDILREQVELIRREPLAYLKKFISEPPKAETHFIDTEKVVDMLSEETKAKNMDGGSEDMVNWILHNVMYEFDKVQGESAFQIHKAITQLLKKWRSEVDERSSYDPKDTQTSNSSQGKLFLDTAEKIMKSTKNNSKKGWFETIDLIQTTAIDIMLNNEDATDFERAKSQSFANAFCTLLSGMKRAQDYGPFENISNFYSSVHQFAMLMQKQNESQYKTIEESDGKESEKLNEISFAIISYGAVAQFMEGIQKSIKNENKTFSLIDEIRKILQEAAQKIGAITDRKNLTERKAEMDIDLD